MASLAILARGNPEEPLTLAKSASAFARWVYGVTGRALGIATKKHKNTKILIPNS